jgi:hypothetical protein
MKSTIDALRAKELLTAEQLAEIDAEWVFGSSVVIPGLLAHIQRVSNGLVEITAELRRLKALLETGPTK